MSPVLRLVMSAAVAALVAVTVPPLAMVALWAVLSDGPIHFFAELGASGVGEFVIGQQRFFVPVLIAGLGAHVVLYCLHRFQPLIYMIVFYCIGAVVYMTMAMPQLAAFALDPPVVRTLALDALLWWGPAATLSGLVFWLVAARPLRRRMARRGR